MRAVDIIEKKRDGGELNEAEISFFVGGFVQGEIPDYQAAAWAMAVLFQGMTARETAHLTQAMAYSGERIDLSGVVERAADKHSTGGVGDKTTLVVEPIVSACGVPVGKMSGRGLSFTGGTLDKMESIPGYRVDLSTKEFIEQLQRVGLVLCGQTADLAPADGKLYALRDVTGTVPSMPLIASSIMSKKIAGGAQAIVLDVKTGLGAFMQTVDQAEKLAKLMVEIGEHAGRDVVALISDMNQPLGRAVGNALEVIEAVETLRGDGPGDLREHSLEVAANMLVLAGEANGLDEARELAEAALEQGSAFEKFKELVEAQDGDVAAVEDVSRLPQAQIIGTVPAPESGYLAEIHAREVGLAVVALGGGRQKKGEPIDHAVGVVLERKVGEYVDEGAALFQVHANDPAKRDEAVERLIRAHRFSSEEHERLPLFYARYPQTTSAAGGGSG